MVSLKHESFDEIIPEHIEIRVDKEIVAFIYKPIACHNYNTIQIGNQEINVATIDTILNFYLAFMFSNAPYYFKDRILCMAQFLFNVEQETRLDQRGILKRFSSTCYGKQETLESIRAIKADKFKQLKDKKDSREFKEWFFKYNPSLKTNSEKNKNSDLVPINYENKKLRKKINKNTYRKTAKNTTLDKLAKMFT